MRRKVKGFFPGGFFSRVLVGSALLSALGAGPRAIAAFQEIVPTDEKEAGGFKDVDGKNDAGAGASPEELAAQEEARRADVEALRKCAKSYDYSMKRRTLELRLQQAKLKHDKAVAATAALFARNEALAKERRAETQKELDGVTQEMAKLEAGCTGRSLPETPKDAAPPPAPKKP